MPFLRTSPACHSSFRHSAIRWKPRPPACTSRTTTRTFLHRRLDLRARSSLGQSSHRWQQISHRLRGPPALRQHRRRRLTRLSPASSCSRRVPAPRVPPPPRLRRAGPALGLSRRSSFRLRRRRLLLRLRQSSSLLPRRPIAHLHHLFSLTHALSSTPTSSCSALARSKPKLRRVCASNKKSATRAPGLRRPSALLV